MLQKQKHLFHASSATEAYTLKQNFITYNTKLIQRSTTLVSGHFRVQRFGPK